MKVLVATDGSEHSMKAVQRGLELAEKQGAQVTLMSVAYYGADYLEGMPPNIKDKLEDEAKAALKKAKALFDKGAVFVDSRTDKDWGAGRIPGAVHLELSKGFTEASLGAKAKKDQDVVMYCNGVSCLRSSEAAAKAVGWGYKKVHYYRLGFPDWKAAGYPVE